MIKIPYRFALVFGQYQEDLKRMVERELLQIDVPTFCEKVDELYVGDKLILFRMEEVVDVDKAKVAFDTYINSLYEMVPKFAKEMDHKEKESIKKAIRQINDMKIELRDLYMYNLPYKSA